MSNWLPSKDAALLTFAVNFGAKISASPSSYSLSSTDATALAALVTAFNSALATATNPSTRTKTACAAKDVAKVQLVADIRSLARRIQASPTVTVPQKTDLGLPIHSATHTPIPAPSSTPLVALEPVTLGTRIQPIKIVDSTDTTKRARPAGVTGAEVYSFVSDGTTTPPANLEDWRFEGIATKNGFAINYRQEDVGKTGTIVARWANSKGETGPLSNPISGSIAA